MTINLRTAFFVFLTVLAVWFLSVEKAILTPFILGIIFAYIFNPVINFFHRWIRLPRTLSIIIIYLVIVSLLVYLGIVLTKQLTNESSELKKFVNNFPENTEVQVQNLPSWIKPMADEVVSFLEKPKFISSSSVFNFFPKAITPLIGFFIFLFSGFYFLKDGRLISGKIMNLVSAEYKSDLQLLSVKINNVLKSYLRGQVFMVFLVSLILYVALSINLDTGFVWGGRVAFMSRKFFGGGACGRGVPPLRREGARGDAPPGIVLTE